MLVSEQIYVCPFCRAEAPSDDKEVVTRLWKQIDEYNDPRAMRLLGDFYLKGEHGLSKNLKKAEELLQRSYDLTTMLLYIVFKKPGCLSMIRKRMKITNRFIILDD